MLSSSETGCTMDILCTGCTMWWTSLYKNFSVHSQQSRHGFQLAVKDKVLYGYKKPQSYHLVSLAVVLYQNFTLIYLILFFTVQLPILILDYKTTDWHIKSLHCSEHHQAWERDINEHSQVQEQEILLHAFKMPVITLHSDLVSTTMTFTYQCKKG